MRALLADLGLKHPDAAKMLRVSLRTLQNWLSGRHEVPYAAYKLLRLLRYMELPGQAWAGWHFSRGHLVTPEGRAISGQDGAWWSLLVRRSEGFKALYERETAFTQALRAGRPDASDGTAKAAGSPDGRGELVEPTGIAGGAAQPPRLDLSNKHFVDVKTEKRQKPDPAAIKRIANLLNISEYGKFGVSS